MELKELMEKRIKARRQILFSRDDFCLSPLQAMIDAQSRPVVISWALDLAEETVLLLENSYPEDPRPREALVLTRQWARGEIKMPIAKRAILACHGAAKETASPEFIAHYHAVGQACGTVHANGHAIGYPIYDLTALLRRYGTDDCEARIAQRMLHYMEKLRYWEDSCTAEPGQWAAFLRK